MKVGVIGSGEVAKSITSGFLKHGHDVVIATRDSAKLKDWAPQNSGARVGTFRDAAQFGEVIVLAVKGSAAIEALRLAGRSSVTAILNQFGWETDDMGKVEGASSASYVTSGRMLSSCSRNSFRLWRCRFQLPPFDYYGRD
jgi:predicted dinucleotide-binding enzyme